MSGPQESSGVGSALTAVLAAVAAAGSIDELRAANNAATGKKGTLTALKSALGRESDPERRREAGREINEAMQQVAAAVEVRERALKSAAFAGSVAADRVDMSELFLRTDGRRGRLHLVTQAMERLEDVFVGLGFMVAEGPEVETDFHNFEALNMPPTHPARSMWDTLFVEAEPEGSVVLRTHTSPVQIRVMQEWPPPIYAVMPGRVFRKETPDANHMPVFHQIEGLVIDRDITFADLAGTIESFTKAFFGSDFTSRLRP
ncbi:MAG: phenylalanine--tRNA ligase subunit alpha, partial [Ilumatobacteraceae bacterium]